MIKKLGSIPDNAIIDLAHDVDLEINGNIGRNVTITAKRGSIKCSGKVGSGSKLVAYFDIETGDIDSDVSLESQFSRIKINGNVGVDCKLQSWLCIFANNVGARTSIISSGSVGSVNIDNVGDNVTIYTTGGIRAGAIGADSKLQACSGIKTLAVGENSTLIAGWEIESGPLASNVTLKSDKGSIITKAIDDRSSAVPGEKQNAAKVASRKNVSSSKKLYAN